MNYYSNQEVEQVLEEPDRQPVPATAHVALNSTTRGKPRKDRTGLKATLFAGVCFVFVLIANIVELPGILLALFAGLLIGVFVYVSIKEGNNVRRD